MKKLIYLSLALLIAVGFSCKSESSQDSLQGMIDKGLDRSLAQVKLMAADLMSQPDKLPRTIGKDGSFATSNSSWWCSGFFPGELWMLYEYTGDEALKTYADNYTRRVEKEQFNTGTHDLGFMLYCSYGHAYRLTGDEYYKNVLIQGANSLCTRFRPNIGIIQSWGSSKKWQCPVIIDNMMNLEFLEEVSKITKDPKYDEIANSHAHVTIKNHFRDDFSTFHVVNYDTLSTEVLALQTAQGYADESSWARGQAWGLYGYTMMYRETKKAEYLEQARHIAQFIMNHPNLPADKVPYWDFNAPNIPNEERDASAGSIIASALIELCQFVEGDESKAYCDLACQILKTLTSDEYLAEVGTNCNFILKHSVGSKPGHSEVDVPLTYADYYYIEALLRLKKLLK